MQNLSDSSSTTLYFSTSTLHSTTFNNLTSLTRQSNLTSSNTSKQLDIPFYTIAISLLFYTLIFIIGFFGNALVILVAIFNRSHQHSTHKCLVNLSIADLLLIIVCMPSAIVDLFSKEVWYFGHFLCKIIPWLEHTIAHASILTIVAISIERSLAIASPLKAKLAFTNKRLWIAVIIIWIISSVSSLPIMQATLYTQGFHRKLNKYVDICVTVTKEKWQLAYLFSTLFLFYLLPCILLFLLYGKVVFVIKERNKKMKNGMLIVPSSNMTSTGNCINKNVELRRSKTYLDRRKSQSFNAAHTIKERNEVETSKLNNLIKKVNRNDSSTTTTITNTSTNATSAKPKDPLLMNANQARKFSIPKTDLQQSSKSINSASKAPLINQKHIIVLLIVMMLLILVCLLPYRVFSLWTVLASKKQLSDLGVVKFYNLITLCRVTFYINSALNPIFYHLISTKFQASFKKFFKFSTHGHGNNGSSSLKLPSASIHTNSKSNIMRQSNAKRFLSLREPNK